ncbi:MAG: hypothetical protein K0R75_952, partial [Paenibacillaceae bacterium]|nr:hypothetical protein [Paenibacillaceae bacterium]
MRFNQLKIPLFYQYLLSYLLLLIIPLSIIGGFVYTYYTAELKRQVTSYNERMMLQLQNNLDSNIKDIVKFSLKLSTESGLTPYALENNYNEYYAKRLLSYPETNV